MTGTVPRRKLRRGCALFDINVGMDFEKLGVFYLGRQVDPESGKATDVPLLYDASDLVTHAVILGMTGSGKTGLGIGLIEEAAIDGIPVIAVDPKGDLSNLLLTFPELRPSDFAPWVNADEARLQGVAVDAHAEREASRWKAGLEEWGQGADRIARLRKAAEFSVYTPGSRAARPISILRTFQAPPPAIAADPELLAERASAAATSVLTLAGIDAEPLRDREHILISTLLSDAWRRNQALDLPSLIAQVQTPPIQRIGVLELDSFYPAGDRFKLASDLNRLLAAPDFAVWLEGDPLDIDALLYTTQGRPRVTVLSIAHLDDRERMFFVAMLLNEVVTWMRAQRGTSTLRAMIYIDEMMGYLPPVAMPASKPPLLTLLKQARAFGLGMTLATQNPVDLDYKALSNAGTWFLGRLQTERDKARVLDGLEGANAASGHGFDRATTDRTLSSLEKRTFLLHNVHESQPVLFKTRWTLSYLRGPLGREELGRLAAEGRRQGASGADGACSCAHQCWAPRRALHASTHRHLASTRGTCRHLRHVPSRARYSILRSRSFSRREAHPTGRPRCWVPPASPTPTPSLVSTRCATSSSSHHSQTVRFPSIGNTPSPRTLRWTNCRASRMDRPRSTRFRRPLQHRRSTRNGRKTSVSGLVGRRLSSCREAPGRSSSPRRTKVNAIFVSGSRPHCASSVMPNSLA